MFWLLWPGLVNEVAGHSCLDGRGFVNFRNTFRCITLGGGLLGLVADVEAVLVVEQVEVRQGAPLARNGSSAPGSAASGPLRQPGAKRQVWACQSTYIHA